jgi:hypothetical protein
LGRWPSAALADARRAMNEAILTTRRLPNLENAAVSAALHEIALQSRRIARNRDG